MMKTKISKLANLLNSKWTPLGIMIGLAFFYSLFHSVLTAALGRGIAFWIMLPVILSSWFYGIRAGLFTSIVFLTLSMILDTSNLSESTSYYLWGGLFLALSAVVVGDLRNKIKNYTQIASKLDAREKYLTVLTEITQTILMGQGFYAALNSLTQIITQLFEADDSYVTRWDPFQERVIPVITPSGKPGQPYSNVMPTPGEKNITTSVLDAGRVLFANDIQNSPYISQQEANIFPVASILGIPLIVNERKLGAIIVAFDTPHQFKVEEIALAEQIGSQIALAMWNIQQEEKISQQLKETNTLVKIGRALSKTERTGTNTVLQLIVDSARELIPRAERSVIHLLDKTENVLISYAVSGYAGRQANRTGTKMPLGSGVAGQVIQNGEAINIPDVHHDPRFLSVTLPPFRSLLVAAIQSGDEQIGTISVQSDSSYAFSADEVELLKALGAQAAIAIENTQLYESTEKRLKEMDVLYHISRETVIAFDPNLLLAEVVKLLKEKFGYYNVQLFLLNTSNKQVQFRSTDQNQTQIPEIDEPNNATASIVEHVAKTGEPFITNNFDQVLFIKQHVPYANIQSELAVPIKIEGDVIGVLDVQHTPPNKLEESDLRFITAIANQLAINMREAGLYTNLQEVLKQEQEMRSQLIQSERLALVGRLLASVSHELNNPLQAIQNALFLIKDEIGLSHQGRQDMDIILSETERMATLIERLRVVYKPMREQDFQPVQINALVEDISILISAHMRQKEIAFEFHPDRSLRTISGIPDQLIQVLLNIFLNAVEAMPIRGRLSVKTEMVEGTDELKITIKDTGPGIDSKLLPNIFNPFVTTKESGTGLGLAISHDIVEQHAGRIEATNHPEGGAIFTIWLPVQQKDYL